VLALADAGVQPRREFRSSRCSRGHLCACSSITLLVMMFTGCTIGLNYSPEPAPVPTHFKELKGWKRANPSDDVDRGDWWKVYNDRALNELLPQIEVSNHGPRRNRSGLFF